MENLVSPWDTYACKRKVYAPQPSDDHHNDSTKEGNMIVLANTAVCPLINKIKILQNFYSVYKEESFPGISTTVKKRIQMQKIIIVIALLSTVIDWPPVLF